MSFTYIPKGYRSRLNLYETQLAIGTLKRIFEEHLCRAINLKRVSAPLFVRANSGLNDNLNGIERPVAFETKEGGMQAEIVHSLAKWKRLALHKYGFPAGEGLYTDMNAIRRDEQMDNIHSIYVDQWDWERVITKQERTVAFLKQIVSDIVSAICDTYERMRDIFPALDTDISREVFFITAQQLEDMYPDLTSKEREDAIVRQHKTVFIMQIGKTLKSGQKHDGRAPDYDDWELNGDILMYNQVLDSALEISSMGIRVDSESLARQLKLSGCEDRKELMFHKMLLNNELPLSIGGGIGQSRLCMLLLKKAHIGEVQVSIWDKDTIEACKEAKVILL
ncbi:MAG TPA: aspartate--ammonia ligase [Clostridia bacterium]|mgnify:FL=1|nr:aspartate--ammonia ligase [Clostridia bacterium]